MKTTDFFKPGSVGVMPTDTIYGLVARAADEPAVAKLYSLKGRRGKPGTIIAASTDQLEELGLKHRYLTPVSQFWPGPISVVVPLDDAKLDYLAQGLHSLAVRIPDDPKLIKLLSGSGPLLTTSANLKGQPVAANIKEAKGYFGDQVDFYIENGDLGDHLPSTVIRIVDDEIEVLREGAIKLSPSGRVLK